jgi:hypothetical protein
MKPDPTRSAWSLRSRSRDPNPRVLSISNLRGSRETTAGINRRQLLIGAGAGAAGAAVALGAAPLNVLASEGEEDVDVQGSWHVNVEVTSPSPSSFDVLYAFARGGVFTRIDGRSNAPSVGTWKRTQDGEIVFSAISFNFNAAVLPSPASRNGAILGKFAAHVAPDGTLQGTFTAEGILGLTGFSRAGTFSGTRIEAVGP